ncbi:MAG: dihydrodipicolinate synthase family protein [Verrucomicrobiales bacterium]
MAFTDSVKPPLRGVIPPLVSPLAAADALDEEALERLIGHVWGGGVPAIFLLGSTGEGPSLSARLRRELVARSCQLAAGRGSVLVGISDTAMAESVALACHAAECGADAVVATTPYYFPPEQSDLVTYFRDLAAALPLPLYLYNMPGLTGTMIEVETVRQLMDEPSIVGIKDSSGDIGYFEDLLAVGRSRSDWSVFMGREELGVTAARLGGHGVVSGSANLVPALHARTWDAIRDQDWPRAKDLEEEIDRLGRAIFTLGGRGVGFIQGLKAALSLAGLCPDRLAPPFSPLPDSDRTELDRRLRALGVLG